jgi:hypothetical protein
VPALPTKNGMALTGLVLGIVTVVFAMLPVVGWWVAVVPGILALVFGIVGAYDACRSDGTGAVRAAIAILLSLSPFPVSLSMAIFYGGI